MYKQYVLRVLGESKPGIDLGKLEMIGAADSELTGIVTLLHRMTSEESHRTADGEAVRGAVEEGQMAAVGGGGGGGGGGGEGGGVVGGGVASSQRPGAREDSR